MYLLSFEPNLWHHTFSSSCWQSMVKCLTFDSWWPACICAPNHWHLPHHTLLILLLPIFIGFCLPSLVLQLSTTPAPPYPPSVLAPLCLVGEEAQDPVPPINSSAWDQPQTRRGTQPLSACPPPPPPPTNSLLLIAWPSHTGREPQQLWQWYQFWCTFVSTDV